MGGFSITTTAAKAFVRALLAWLAAMNMVGCAPAVWRYDSVQQRSSHNSFAADESLFDLLVYHRIRSLELDLHIGKIGSGALPGDWWVYHLDIPGDRDSSVDRMSVALERLATFHRAFPRHEVVTVWLDHELGLHDHTAAEFDALVAGRLGAAVFRPGDLLAACRTETRAAAIADLAAAHAAIRDRRCHWPLLEELQGRFVFVVAAGADGYARDPDTLARRLAFVAQADVSPPHVFFGNRSDPNPPPSHGTAIAGAGFVGRNYGGLLPGLDSRGAFEDAQRDRYHHLATNRNNADASPWARTHNATLYPFCPLGEVRCAEQLPGKREPGELHEIRATNGDLPVGRSTRDSALFVASWEPVPAQFSWRGFIASASSEVEPWAKGCLMLRASVDPQATYYAVCRAADNHGLFAQHRAEGCIGPCGTAFVNAELGEEAMYARIDVRPSAEAGIEVTGLASLDGLHWKQLGPAVRYRSPLPRWGLSVSSHGSAEVRFYFGDLALDGQRWRPAPALFAIGPQVRPGEYADRSGP